MDRLVPIYKILVGNRKHQLTGWYRDYKKTTENIQRIKKRLEEGSYIKENATYAGTIYEKDETSFQLFVRHLLYDMENGVSSRGQSVLSKNNLNKFLSTAGFDEIIKDLITHPGLESYEKLKDFWESQDVGNNPVLVNRAIAACDIRVTSTVDEGRFNQVFDWLQTEELIPTYENEAPQDWYSRNRFVMEEMKKQLGETEEDDLWISIFFWEMHINLANPFHLKKQIVKYGAPGTGKTYQAKEVCSLQFDIWKSQFAESVEHQFEAHHELIQFHPSYSYEDFIEGLRPVLDEKGEAQLQLQNGVFKDLCIRAAKWEKDLYELGVFEDLEKLTLKDVMKHAQALSSKAHWKKILGYKNQEKKLSSLIPPFFLIIDEINRAELSRVFGELMYCLEYRGPKGMVKTQYAQLNTEATGLIKAGGAFQFFVPGNIYLLATMNTIDRSIESFDFALRRRFRWEEVLPDTELLRHHLTDINTDWPCLADNLKSLNQAIKKQPFLGEAYCIGHAYLMNLPYAKNTKSQDVRRMIWKDSIAPLLQEYIRGAGQPNLMHDFAKAFGI